MIGYFPNGSAGMDYEERFCNRCVHEQGCAVWLAHMLHNYRDCNDKDSILHMLIPLSDDGLGNEECRMFHQDDEKKRGMDTDQKYLDWKRSKAALVENDCAARRSSGAGETEHDG